MSLERLFSEATQLLEFLMAAQGGGGGAREFFFLILKINTRFVEVKL